MNKIQAYNQFWNSFGLKAYDENSVPINTEFPYITYDLVIGEFNDTVASNVSLWYRSTSWKDIQEKEMEIADYITRGGRMVKYDNGAFWIRKGSPWAQRMTGDDDSVRRIVLNIVTEYLD